MRRPGNKKQVRLEDDVHAQLVLIQKNCDWPVSISTLASYGVRVALRRIKRTFTQSSK